MVISPRDGQVILLEADRNGDGRTDGLRVLAEGLDGSNGIDLAATRNANGQSSNG